MAINMFEGGRRFSKLVAFIWIIGWIIKVLNEGMQGDPIVFASVVFGGLLFILVFTWAIGWIVRGFRLSIGLFSMGKQVTCGIV